MRNLFIPAIVIAAVGIMIFPLPSLLLDILLAANIAFALALLINSLYIRDADSFTALPTLLLLATLFRLSLNVSTTRQLLAEGTAPDSIVAFGNFVVHGNLVVGLVLFIIVTVVQFLVIAKGAERVAEVSARFTLDAMPGKQMAIDADMRAGFLTAYEAKEKRLELQRESKLYGALDGAMKFVKGDAIAGLLITVINITAGFLIGISMHGLSLGEAASRYTLFTVGDGLISQIPALLVSVAAGIAVTQVSDKNGALFGASAMRQLGREPQALGAVGVVLLILAIAPGMPATPFLLGGIVFLVVSAVRLESVRSERTANRESSFAPKRYLGFVLRMGPATVARLSAERHLAKLVTEFRNSFFERWGVQLPDVTFDVDDTIADETMIVYLNQNRLKAVELSRGSACDAAVEVIRAQSEMLIAEFIDDTQVRKLLELHGTECEDLINDLIPDAVSVTELGYVLRSLITEGIPIGDFRNILQGVADYRMQQCTVTEGHSQYTSSRDVSGVRSKLSCIRKRLKRTITAVALGGDEELRVWVLAPELDAVITEVSSVDAISLVDLTNRLLAVLKEHCLGEGTQCSLIASQGSREVVHRMVYETFPHMRVLAAEELDSSVPFHILGEIGSVLVQHEDFSNVPTQQQNLQAVA